MPRFIKMWLFSALISITAVGMWKGIEWYYSEDIEELPSITITAEALAEAYEDGSGGSYTGRYVILTGVVTDKGSADTYYTVNLDGALFYNIELKFYDLDEISKLSSVDIGETIIIEGLIDGLSTLYISISGCSIQ